MQEAKQEKNYKQRCIVFFLGFVVASIIIFSGCSNSLKLISTWRQGNIVVDGNGTEWQSGLYYDKESDIVYSIRNDDDYVYFFLKTQDRATQMQIIRSGFTIWFDPNDGNGHSFGIRYPLAGQGTHSEFSSESDDGQRHSFFDQELLELEILGSQKEDVQRFSTLDVPGIHAKIGHIQESLVYELQVSLKKTLQTPYAIGATSISRIGVGLETEEFNRDKRKEGTRPTEGLNGSEPGNPHMEGGEYENRGYPDGGRREGMREKRQKQGQLKIWLSVQLAHSAGAAH